MLELVSDNNSGLLFEAGNIDDLIQKVLLITHNQSLRQQLGKNARRSFEQRYSTDENYKILLNIYRSVIDNRKELTRRIERVSV